MNRRTFLKGTAALSLLPLLHQGQRMNPTPPPTSFPIRDARLNTDLTPLQEEIDFIYQGHLYVAYSPRLPEPGQTVPPRNVKMVVLNLGGGHVVLHGTGYGDHYYRSKRTADADMQRVHQIIQQEFGYLSANIQVISPHAHPDHLNPEAIRCLRGLGHQVQVWLHIDAQQYIFNQPQWMVDQGDRGIEAWWDQETLDSMIYVHGTGATNALKELQVPLGRVWIRHCPYHMGSWWPAGQMPTDALDLVIDLNDDPTQRIVFHGTGRDGGEPYGNPPGTLVGLHPHHNTILPPGL